MHQDCATGASLWGGRCYGAGGRLARGAPAEAFRGRLLGDEALLARAALMIVRERV